MDIKLIIMEDKDNEIWEYIHNTDNMYKVSNKGRVMSFHKGHGHYLNPSVTKKGYARISICFCDGKRQVFVHRIVAEVFLENPYGYKEINHKDGNKLNNNVDNLEYCSSKYNSWHKYNVLGYSMSDDAKKKLSEWHTGKTLSDKTRMKMSLGHVGKKRSKESVEKTALGKMKKVIQMNQNMDIINMFNSVKEASEMTYTCKSEISSVCNGKKKTANGFIWRFA